MSDDPCFGKHTLTTSSESDSGTIVRKRCLEADYEKFIEDSAEKRTQDSGSDEANHH